MVSTWAWIGAATLARYMLEAAGASNDKDSVKEPIEPAAVKPMVVEPLENAFISPQKTDESDLQWEVSHAEG